MKMLKKIMAVVLTGALAASMLTGCAIGDAVKANALEDALNSVGVQGKTQVVDYVYDHDLNSKADTIYKKFGNDDDARKGDLKNHSTLTATTDANGGANKYAYIVVEAPKTSDAKKSINWDVKTALHDKLYTESALAQVGGKSIKNYAAQGATIANKVKFGVKFVDDGAKTKTYYAIVVVELAA